LPGTPLQNLLAYCMLWVVMVVVVVVVMMMMVVVVVVVVIMCTPIAMTPYACITQMLLQTS